MERNEPSTKRYDTCTKRNGACSKSNDARLKSNDTWPKSNDAGLKRNDTWRRCSISTPSGEFLSNAPGHRRSRLQPCVTAADETNMEFQTRGSHPPVPL